jgi:hypothetical protein
LPVRSLAGLTVRRLLRVLTRLLTVWALARIRRLRLAPRGRLPVRPGLLLPVRIRRILPVRRLLPVIAHADKISARGSSAERS